MVAPRDNRERGVHGRALQPAEEPSSCPLHHGLPPSPFSRARARTTAVSRGTDSRGHRVPPRRCPRRSPWAATCRAARVFRNRRLASTTAAKLGVRQPVTCVGAADECVFLTESGFSSSLSGSLAFSWRGRGNGFDIFRGALSEWSVQVYGYDGGIYTACPEVLALCDF